MNNPGGLDQARLRALSEASAWRVRLTEARAESSTELESWLAAHPANAEAWTDVQTPWHVLGEAAATPEVWAARSDALRRARQGHGWRWRVTQIDRRVGVGLVAASAAAILVFATLVALPPTDDYRAPVGERQTVTLKDGSRVTLDSNSEVKVRYTAGARQLQLLRGQARFDVAHDTSRPFTVQARNETVVATGTAFNIDLQGPKVLVTLIQGHVTILIHARAAPLMPVGSRLRAAPSIALVAGQQLITTPSASPKIEVASLDKISAWQSGQLIFDDETLASVAERVSRYTHHPITVDADVAALRISGVFNTGEVSAFVDSVTRYLPVEAHDAPDGSVELRRRS